MTQKIIKIGSSVGVTIPKSSLKDLGFKEGDKVEVVVDKVSRTVTIAPTVGIDKELVEWTDSFIGKYKKALDELSRK